MRRRAAWAVVAAATAVPEARADEAAGAPQAPIEVTVRAERGVPGRASSRVDRREMDERLPRSAPDALKYEPGVFVQQTAHGQASPYVRGRTGQQTVLAYDGIRLNTSTYRQGPNQYFFTVDAHAVQSIEVVRGGASTAWGSDAIGGVLHARPVEPTLDPERPGVRVRPRAFVRYASADSSFGERFQADAQLGPDVAFLAGAGYRVVGKLRSGGAVLAPDGSGVPPVPAFESDGTTQLGTGFREVTADGRVVWALAPGRRLVAAAHAYRQYDAPRTDQCPPPLAPRAECLTIDEQFRTLAYLSLEGSGGPVARATRLAVSYQRQHERRRQDRPASFVQNGGRDDVDTTGVLGRLETVPAAVARWASIGVQSGADLYVDRVASVAWTRFTDAGVTLARTRGQYADGSAYAQGGGFAQVEMDLAGRAAVRVGGRAGGARARAPGDVESGTRGVDRGWLLLAGHAGVEVRPADALALLGNVDRSVRAPNLDDLTSRQQTGPGFQFENPDLRPERGTTVEAGARVRTAGLDAEAWVFRSWLDDAITRVGRAAADCPVETPQCGASASRYQLANVAGSSIIDGVEAAARARLPGRVTLRGTFAWTVGTGPNPAERPSDPRLPYEERVPLSRIPPPNGTFEARWDLGRGAWSGGALRWAATQDRLAPSDRSDARIPGGGTPGFAVFDLRGGWRVRREMVVAVVVENVADTPYRYHGSSVNGPGRGVVVSLEVGP